MRWSRRPWTQACGCSAAGWPRTSIPSWWPVTGRSPLARTRRPRSSTEGSRSSTCPLGRQRWSGPRRSRPPAAVLKRSGSPCPTRRWATERSPTWPIRAHGSNRTRRLGECSRNVPDRGVVRIESEPAPRPRRPSSIAASRGESDETECPGRSGTQTMRICIVGASGKLGQYMVQQSLDRGYEVVGVCREQSVGKLDAFKGRITVIPGATDDREVIKRAVAGCDGILVVMTPRGVHGYSTGTTQAVLDYAPPGARLIFSCGWHITLDGQDVYSLKLKTLVKVFGPLARLARFADLDDQVEAARRIFASDTRWTVVRGSDLEEGESQGLPVWSTHVGDPILESNITRRVDFALFMVEALDNDELG